MPFDLTVYRYAVSVNTHCNQNSQQIIVIVADVPWIIYKRQLYHLYHTDVYINYCTR